MFGLFYEDISSDWRRTWLPTPVSLIGESHGQRSPGGLHSMGSPSDTTEEI